MKTNKKPIRNKKKRCNYIGLHCGSDGRVFVECINASNRTEAFRLMERNDTNLSVITFKEFDVLYSKIAMEIR